MTATALSTPPERVRRVVGIGEMQVASGTRDLLITYALGSCLGITLYDPVAGVGALLHAMLPDSRIDPDKARLMPARFVDTGVPQLFRACYSAGAQRERLILRVAGGAATQEAGMDRFQIGARNITMLRKLLWKNAILIRGEDVGGTQARTLSLDMATGVVAVKSNGTESRL